MRSVQHLDGQADNGGSNPANLVAKKGWGVGFIFCWLPAPSPLRRHTNCRRQCTRQPFALYLCLPPLSVAGAFPAADAERSEVLCAKPLGWRSTGRVGSPLAYRSDLLPPDIPMAATLPLLRRAPPEVEQVEGSRQCG